MVQGLGHPEEAVSVDMIATVGLNGGGLVVELLGCWLGVLVGVLICVPRVPIILGVRDRLLEVVLLFG